MDIRWWNKMKKKFRRGERWKAERKLNWCGNKCKTWASFSSEVGLKSHGIKYHAV